MKAAYKSDALGHDQPLYAHSSGGGMEILQYRSASKRREARLETRWILECQQPLNQETGNCCTGSFIVYTSWKAGGFVKRKIC